MAKWYLRDIDQGKVWGPMSKDEAESMADQLDDVVMFDERIFEPQFITSEEVELLLRDLRDMKSGCREDAVGNLCQRAEDAITLLSAKKLVHGTVEGGILDISEVSPGIEVVVNDYDIQEVDEDRLSEDEDGRRCVRLEYGE
jgi:hypothetical protein